MIRSTYYQTEQPKIVTTDSRGTTIAPDLRVAYNRSGNVAIGTIEKLAKNEWRKSKYGWRLHFELVIKNENGNTSTVKNPNAFVII
jgi:hypothetical protein